MNLYLSTPHTYEIIMKLYLAGAQGWGKYAHENFRKEMEIYLAGAMTGNNNYIFRKYADNPEKAFEEMNLYLAGRFPCDETLKGSQCVDDTMDIYIAGNNGGKKEPLQEEMKLHLALANSGAMYPRDNGDLLRKIYILESFYYIDDWMLPYIKDYWNFLLDSGAYTFMSNAKTHIDWDEYLERYARFIVENDIKLFFELDIDSVVGIKEVERLRDKLETLTNRKCIPVWHRSRGKDYWLKMATDYDYIAIGGIVSKEIEKKDFRYFPKLIELAAERGARVHGLGFTQLAGLKKYKFHSVDSTAWIYGNRGGFLQKFNGETLIKISAPEGKRMKARETAIHNFNEWVKFQRYAEENL